MAILSKEEAKTILEKVMKLSKADECEANLDGYAGGNIRYARNTVSTSGAETNANLVVQSSFGKKVGTANINEFDDASLEKVVRRSEELAQLAPENPEFMPNLGPQKYLDSKCTFDSTENVSPEDRAKVAEQSISICEKEDLVAAGFMEDYYRFASMMNSSDLFAYGRSSSIDFSVTVRTKDGTGSGYAIRDFNDFSQFDSAAATAIAAKKAASSKQAKAIEPGKYTVILEPAASVGLIQRIAWNYGMRSADEGRSFLSKAGGGTKLGEKVFDESVTLYSDPQDPNVPGSTWAGDGRARKKTVWIENGIVKNMHCQRYWAEKNGYEPIPFPSNIIMKGGDKTTEELIKSTKKGILVTRTWYIRSVDPQTLLQTGLTRDGTFYIENGEIKYPVKNFRFNESPIIMLNNIEELGKVERVNGYMIPVMKVRDFTFSSLSDAI